MVERCIRKTPQIGEIYYMRFTGSGSEQDGWRPGVVFQNNVGNYYSPNLIVLPLTSSLKKVDMPTHVLVKSEDVLGLKRDSMVLCENPQRMSKNKLGGYIDILPEEYMRKIAVASLLASSAISFLDMEALIAVWEKATSLNNKAAS